MDLTVELKKIIFILIIAICGHAIALLVKFIHRKIIKKSQNRKKTKWLSFTSLGLSILVFTIYFIAFGQILKEFDVSLTTYFASASVIGLAVAFGSQGVVQDVVTGMTLVFSDLLDIGDMVEIGGQTGYVENITMRFITIKNAHKATIYIPNRTISNVINYSYGKINYYVDVRLPKEQNKKAITSKIIAEMVGNFEEQYPSYFIGKTAIIEPIKTNNQQEITRIVFKLWPARYTLIETNFKQELVARIKEHDSSFSDWMISCAAEISGE